MSRDRALGLLTPIEIEKFEKDTNSVVVFDPNGRAIGFQKTNEGDVVVMIDEGDESSIVLLEHGEIERLKKYLCS